MITDRHSISEIKLINLCHIGQGYVALPRKNLVHLLGYYKYIIKTIFTVCNVNLHHRTSGTLTGFCIHLIVIRYVRLTIFQLHGSNL